MPFDARSARIVLAACLLAPTLLSCAMPAMAASKTFALPAFRNLLIKGDYSIDIGFKSGAPTMTATGDQAALDGIGIQPASTITTIAPAAPSEADKAVHIRMTLPMLVYVSHLGSGPVSIKNWSGDALIVEVLKTGSLKATGKCGALSVGVGYYGTADTSALKCDTTYVGSRSKRDVRVYAREAFKTQILASGNVFADGDPPICLVMATGTGRARCGKRDAAPYTEQ